MVDMEAGADEDAGGRWGFAQVPPNVQRVYYYQPSTGKLSRTEPSGWGYLDTCHVWRMIESKVKEKQAKWEAEGAQDLSLCIFS